MPSAGRRAITFALAQVGKRYVFGTRGPNTFDCSGLVSASYAAAGCTDLVPYTRTLYSQTERIHSVHELGAGDLVFYYGTAEHGYADVSHVAMYIGRHRRWNGRRHWSVVQATDPAHGVEVVGMSWYATPTGFGRVVEPNT
jgi:cell wall-associated NlpC family hydrolase